MEQKLTPEQLAAIENFVRETNEAKSQSEQHLARICFNQRHRAAAWNDTEAQCDVHRYIYLHGLHQHDDPPFICSLILPALRTNLLSVIRPSGLTCILTILLSQTRVFVDQHPHTNGHKKWLTFTRMHHPRPHQTSVVHDVQLLTRQMTT